MAHITAGVEYGLHCLLYLVHPLGLGRTASARDLADLQGVPVEYVAKLFTKLQKAGLVAASEGARGGFRLARESRSISVLDVVLAIDGKKPLFECREIRGRCAIFGRRPPAWATRGVCSIHAVLLEADARMRETLASCTLSDLAARVTAKAPAAYGREIATWLEKRAPEPRRAHTNEPSI
jgi:Rrf2 family protein